LCHYLLKFKWIFIEFIKFQRIFNEYIIYKLPGLHFKLPTCNNTLVRPSINDQSAHFDYSLSTIIGNYTVKIAIQYSNLFLIITIDSGKDNIEAGSLNMESSRFYGHATNCNDLVKIGNTLNGYYPWSKVKTLQTWIKWRLFTLDSNNDLEWQHIKVRKTRWKII